MMQHSNRKIILLSALCIALVLGITYLWMSSKTSDSINSNLNITQQTSPIIASGLTIMVPDNISDYRQKITDFVQIGGTDPLPTQVFVPKHLAVFYSGDIQKASAETAAQQFPTGGGPEKVLVNYFKVQSGTAYVVLNIDEDGRAGVSVSIAMIHPVVEKTLLQFDTIKQVVFGYASGDKQIIQ